MNKKAIVLIISVAFSFICKGQKAAIRPTEITNVRTEINPQALKVTVTYDLISKKPSDEIKVRFFADGKKIKSPSVKGDIGFNVETQINRQIKWDFVKDGMKGNVDLQAEVYATHPTMFVGTKGKLLLTGLIGAAGASIYSGVLANKISSDVKSYNNASDPLSASEQQTLNELKGKIEKNKATFNTAVSIAAALLVTDVILFKKTKKPNNISLHNALGVPSISFSRKF